MPLTNKEQISIPLSVMLSMQDRLNKQVFLDWHTRKLAWHRAIYIEAGEYLEHLSTWKWWKKGSPDYAQANMELVDIWHFGISQIIEGFGIYGAQAYLEKMLPPLLEANQALTQEERSQLDVELIHAQVDRLVAVAGTGKFDLYAFFALLGYSGLSFTDLYKQYVGKNILNMFRQDNGYKQGTYLKNWEGKEDNEHLSSLLDELSVDEELPHAVYTGLQARYPKKA